jgi:hypothetical protein
MMSEDLAVGDGEHRLEPAQHAVGAPVLGELHRGAQQVALVLLELRLEALEEREGVGGRAREAREDAVLVERRTLRAEALTTMLPSVTWPSPPMATRSPRRTERMVVPWNCGGSWSWGAISSGRAARAEIAMRPGISAGLAAHQDRVAVARQRLEQRRVELVQVGEDHALAGELDRLDHSKKRRV